MHMASMCWQIEIHDFAFLLCPDDVFSSLNGITFDWNLQSDAESGVPAQNVLR
jgi:hypothetical protein